jgi:hypothetical protein
MINLYYHHDGVSPFIRVRAWLTFDTVVHLFGGKINLANIVIYGVRRRMRFTTPTEWVWLYEVVVGVLNDTRES